MRSHSLLLLIGLAAGLSGCGTVNEKLSAGMGDYVPQWAGGLPADAPPRPGTAKYDEWMKERERLRQLPADQSAATDHETFRPLACAVVRHAAPPPSTGVYKQR